MRSEPTPASDAAPDAASGREPGPPADTAGRPWRIAVVAAGLRQPSTTSLLAERLGEAVAAALETAGSAAELTTVELRPHAAALAEALVTGRADGELGEAIAAVVSADALVAVSPTFAASYAGLFKSFFDVLRPADLVGKPTLIGATGGSARHSLVIEYAMRPLLGYFQAVMVPTGVFAAPDDLADPVAAERLAGRIARAGAELAALMAGGDTVRPAAAPRPAGNLDAADWLVS